MNWRSLFLGIVGGAGVSLPGTTGFSFPQAIAGRSDPALRYSVLINEFLPDPEPSAGLPPSSFIEIKNVSGSALSLLGWSIGNGKTAAVVRSEIILAPDSLIVFCPAAAAVQYSNYGNTFGLTGFPSLSHVAGQVILTGPAEEVVDAVVYDRESFNDPVKAEGGWSLERIDATKPCLGQPNWTASSDPAGGTPGRENSENAAPGNSGNPEEANAGFIRSYCPDSNHILLLLSGPADEKPAANLFHYQITPAEATIVAAETVPPFADRILLTLNKPLNRRQIYQISATGLSSCDVTITDAVLRAGLPEPAESGDILFNEILFNPPAFGTDYIELYQAGNKVIDLQNCQLASRDVTGQIKDPRPVTSLPWLLFPRDYLVVTEDRPWVQAHYLVKAPTQLLELSQMPSMPDNKGIIVLLNSSGQVIDELPYDHQWHSPLIADESGVALEKIGPELASAVGGNWTSAASTSGFGTPTYVNSESGLAGYDSSRSTVAAEPAIFSPDNDGYNDFCFVTVRPGIPGFTANISVFDINGINIRSLASGASLGAEGKFRWDGSGDAGNPLASGRYVVFTEIFSLRGTVRRFKNVVVLARNR